MPARATDLVRERGRVSGVVCAEAGGEVTVRAHCVIAADGRYSKIRQLARIRNVRSEAFDLDVLWFKVPLEREQQRAVQIFRGRGNPVLAYPSVPDRLQLGWTLPHGGYGDLRSRGLPEVLDQVRALIPPYAGAIAAHITDLRQLTLLDVFAARAESWASDGLLLIGDSAHTHSPLGAQGINLAIQDAVVAYPILLESLHRRDASAQFLRRYRALRGPDIDAVMKMQVMQSRGMSSTRRSAVARRVMTTVLPHTPLLDKITRRIALGNPDIRVAAGHAVANR
jgi:monooxygenase